MKWTKEQLTEASLVLVKWKSQLAKIDHKFEKERMELRMPFGKRLDFNRKYSPLKKKILEMENEFLLNVAGNGIEGEENAEPPPANQKKQTFKDTV
jgi:hypothetical protein